MYAYLFGDIAIFTMSFEAAVYSGKSSFVIVVLNSSCYQNLYILKYIFVHIELYLNIKELFL